MNCYVCDSEENKNIYFKSKIKLFNYGLKVLNFYFPQKGRLLDIGAAFGDFMELALKEGWQVEGVELSDKMVQKARQKGLTIYSNPIEDLDLKSGSYEAITAYEVFSQMETPKKAMLEVYRILKPQGVLLLREFNSIFHIKLLGLFNLKLFSVFNLKPGVMHNFNFNKQSLETLLRNTGFKEIRIKNSRPTIGDPYGTGGKLGSIFISVFKTVYYILSQAIYYLSFGNLCIGSSLVVIARK
jgi:2-polyprenyl-3-methyl-5-hydroxy-6-metoxy-1,4-benzoquinol methylase